MAQLNEGEGDGWNDKVRYIYRTVFLFFDTCTEENILDYIS